MAMSQQPPREALLLDPATRVTCPRCEYEFSLEEGFAKKSLEAIETASLGALEKLQAEARAVEEKRAGERAAQREALLQEQLKDQQAILEAQKQQHAEALERMRQLDREAAEIREADLKKRLNEQAEQIAAAEQARAELAAREKALTAEQAGLAERVEREAAVRAEALAVAEKSKLAERLKAQDAQIASLQANELALRKDRQELEAKQQQFELEVQRKLDEERKQIADNARATEAERAKLEKADLQKKLDDTLAKLADTQRQLEQGSQQLQGEVLELLLEQELGAAFPMDEIAEVKKGARGGDALHSVRTRSEQVAGIILWEAKRAQRWSGAWPGKLKEDMRQAGAVAGVIVTTSFPAEWPDGQVFGLHEGVWLTVASAAIPLASVLREGLLEAHKARVASANKGEKMEAVYDYLTSPQFAHKLKAVYDVFDNQRKELHVERTTTMQRWKRREKQIELATVQLVGIAGDLQGLAQQDLPQLELAPRALEEPDDENDESAGEEEQE
jgi:hypothetical protein